MTFWGRDNGGDSRAIGVAGVTEGGREEQAEHGIFRAAKRSVGRDSGGCVITTCQIPVHTTENEPERKQQAVAGNGSRAAPGARARAGAHGGLP